jgi:hypothetical protein
MIMMDRGLRYLPILWGHGDDMAEMHKFEIVLIIDASASATLRKKKVLILE